MGKFITVVVVLAVIGGIITGIGAISGAFTPQSIKDAREMCELRMANMWPYLGDVEWGEVRGDESAYELDVEVFSGQDVWTAASKDMICTATLEPDGIYQPEVLLDL